MMGFRFDCDPAAPGNVLPLIRTMFHGHTLVECNENEEVILRLMSDMSANRARMMQFLQNVEEGCTAPAGLECVPENASTVTKEGPVQAQGLLSVDSKAWTPEFPERIGLYHAYIRGFNRDVRTHRLFISCTGGMSRASDAFCNLVIDVGKGWTAKDICESEEAWWLRKGCQRARCRLIKSLADEFGLSLTHMQDIHSYDRTQAMLVLFWYFCFYLFLLEHMQIALPTTDTLEHDMGVLRDGQTERVAVYNACVDTTRNLNGIACNMHPSEGVWLFRGSPRGSCFGSMFGDYQTCGIFPTCAPRVRRPQSILVGDSSAVVRLHSRAERDWSSCFDEAYFKNLERMQWNRDNGFIELIPIVVGLQ